jgi:RNA polymerase sigma factor (sigma-70 family)
MEKIENVVFWVQNMTFRVHHISGRRSKSPNVPPLSRRGPNLYNPSHPQRSFLAAGRIMATSPTPSSSLSPGSRFAATRWSIVIAAGDRRAATAARRAMGELARQYWFPLYAYLRRKGLAPPQAEDLVQGFFTRLLEKDALAAADRSRGKFRSFLLASLQNFLANEWDKAHAQKRGGTAAILAFDALDAETRYAAEPADEMTPERVFERRWALAVLDQVLTRLREEYAQRGQTAVFAALEAQVLVGGDTVSHRQIAAQLGLTEGAAKVAAHRLRQRFRQLLRDEISQTVSDHALVDEELRQLLASL